MPPLHLHFNVAPEGARADLAVAQALRADARYAHLARPQIKEALSYGLLLIDGRRMPGATRLAPGRYELTSGAGSDESWLEPALARPRPAGCALPIAHEDDELLVLHKPAGIPSVPHAPEETESAVSSALARFPALAGIGRGGLEPGLLHRLDTGTSGLLAFAKTEAAYQRLRQEWSNGAVQKVYRAVVSGTAPLPRLPAVQTPELAHDAHSAKRMRVVTEAPGTHAYTTHYRGKPIPTWTRLVRAHASSAPFHDLEIEIRTGAMHQIRCTLAHLGIPIWGDPIYGQGAPPRLWLHAWKLTLPHGSRTLSLEAPLPPGWPTFQRKESE